MNIKIWTFVGKKRKLSNIMFKTSSFIKNNLIKTSITRDKEKKSQWSFWTVDLQILRQMLYRLSYHVFTSLSTLFEFFIYTIFRGFFRLLTSRRVTARHVTARHVSFLFFCCFFFYIASMYIQIKSLKYWNDIRFCPDFPHHCNRHINLSCRENTRWSRENIDDGCTLAHECKVSKVYYI